MIEIFLMTLTGFLAGVLAGYRRGQWESEDFEQAWHIANATLASLNYLCARYEQALQRVEASDDAKVMRDFALEALHADEPNQQ